jgi:adenine-specific DNA-methyltransferase
MNKTEIIQEIKQLESLTHDERSYLVELVNTKKKYGLVWEDKPEDVEEQLRTQLPVLREVVERRIEAQPEASPNPSKGGESKKAVQNLQQLLFEPENIVRSGSSSLPLGEGRGGALSRGGASSPNHILIEGDNLHALTALTFTHEGLIDVMYFDPPYNTGKEKEFKYNDKWVDAEDSFRHSKWISFMNKRLKIAYGLLSENGLLFVSIDDNEIAQVKLLLDELFDKNISNPKNSNCLGVLVWNLGTGTQAGHFVRSHEYVLAYCKNKKLLANFKGGNGEIEHSALKKISRKNPASEFQFPAGVRFEGIDGLELLTEWGGSEKMFLISGRMICKDGKLKEPVSLKAGWAQKRQMEQWFAGEETYDSKNQRVMEFFFNSSGILKYRKQRGVINPKTVLSDVGSTKSGSEELKNILGSDGGFDYPKSVELIKFLTGLYGENFVMLDFFAGSGTTLQAIIELNAEDGGNRQCILVTNNENNIAEEVCYERNRRVIKGYTNSKGEWVPGLTNNNLRYYKSEFIDREPSLKNKRELTRLATELLCIKEDCYEEQKPESIKKSKDIRYFEENGKRILIVYEDDAIEQSVEFIKSIVSSTQVPENAIKVYVFSPGQYPFTEEFEEVLPYVTLCALPDAIYKAYLNVLPKKQRAAIPTIEDETDSEPTLFE